MYFVNCCFSGPNVLVGGQLSDATWAAGTVYEDNDDVAQFANSLWAQLRPIRRCTGAYIQFSRGAETRSGHQPLPGGRPN